ncbi:hypothetical protein GCM10028803_30860 [Larkinella knui]
MPLDDELLPEVLLPDELPLCLFERFIFLLLPEPLPCISPCVLLPLEPEPTDEDCPPDR